MKGTQLSAIAIAFSTLFAGQAMAAHDAPVTRAQVQAELAEAVRTGNIVPGESGQRLNQLYPNNYPAQQTSSTVTRAQVKAELAEARRTGNIAVSESGAKLNDLYPQNYPAQHDVASKTREQVRTELAEAISNGLYDRRIEA